jgi:L-arabinose isomerase
MGDFAVPADTLSRTIGVTTVLSSPEALGGYLPLPDAPEVLEELAADQIRFDCSAVSPDAHRESVRTGIALRRWMETERLTGFSVNFLDCDLACGLTTMPFLEADKAMARGTGYAGEGDVLTAALVGALAAIYPQTTFTEMFCPDWAANRIFVSHMGEVNSDLIVGTPILKEKPFPWTDVAAPVCPVGCLKRGEAILVNLAPGSSDTYTLILAPVTMLEGGPDDRMGDTVHGWLSPTLPIDEFLAGYSRLGGTHHCALVYGEVLATLVGFGTLMGWKISVIGGEG